MGCYDKAGPTRAFFGAIVPLAVLSLLIGFALPVSAEVPNDVCADCHPDLVEAFFEGYDIPRAKGVYVAAAANALSFHQIAFGIENFQVLMRKSPMDNRAVEAGHYGHGFLIEILELHEQL